MFDFVKTFVAYIGANLVQLGVAAGVGFVLGTMFGGLLF